jgi:chromosome segregation ATPase
LFQEIKDHTAVFQKLSGDIVGINSKLNTLSFGVENEDEKQERVKVLSSLDGKIGKLEEEFKSFYPLNAENSDCCDKVKAEIGDLNAKIGSLSLTNNDQNEANADILINLKSQSEATEQLRERVRQLEVALNAAQESQSTINVYFDSILNGEICLQEIC